MKAIRTYVSNLDLCKERLIHDENCETVYNNKGLCIKHDYLGGGGQKYWGTLQFLLHWTVTCTRPDCSKISNSCVAHRTFMVIYFIP